MRTVEKARYKVYLDKGRQHSGAADAALKGKSYDAAITNYCIALINDLDALSVNRFGKDLSSDSHEAAPITLQGLLNELGISDFKALAVRCVEVLRMKNKASYRSESLTAEDARRARKVARDARAFVESRLADLA